MTKLSRLSVDTGCIVDFRRLFHPLVRHGWELAAEYTYSLRACVCGGLLLAGAGIQPVSAREASRGPALTDIGQVTSATFMHRHHRFVVSQLASHSLSGCASTAAARHLSFSQFAFASLRSGRVHRRDTDRCRLLDYSSDT